MKGRANAVGNASRRRFKTSQEKNSKILIFKEAKKPMGETGSSKVERSKSVALKLAPLVYIVGYNLWNSLLSSAVLLIVAFGAFSRHSTPICTTQPQ